MARQKIQHACLTLQSLDDVAYRATQSAWQGGAGSQAWVGTAMMSRGALLAGEACSDPPSAPLDDSPPP